MQNGVSHGKEFQTKPRTSTSRLSKHGRNHVKATSNATLRQLYKTTQIRLEWASVFVGIQVNSLVEEHSTAMEFRIREQLRHGTYGKRWNGPLSFTYQMSTAWWIVKWSHMVLLKSVEAF